MSNREWKQTGKLIRDWMITGGSLAVFFWMVFGCSLARDYTIPSEPTIWIVSEIFEDTKNPFPNGLVGYKMIPVNPGSINAKATWKVDYRGKYTVGQRVDFVPVAADQKK